MGIFSGPGRKGLKNPWYLYREKKIGRQKSKSLFKTIMGNMFFSVWVRFNDENGVKTILFFCGVNIFINNFSWDHYQPDPFFLSSRMSRWKLGSTVRINGLFHPNIPHIYKSIITHLQTIDPNFQRVI